MSEQTRLDAALVSRGMVSGRDKAKVCIAAGAVTVNGKTVTKASLIVCDTDEVACSIQPRFVGRGGEKLEKLLTLCDVPLNGCCCADIGASTGGFTDCMLQHGAARVYAVDVGHGQLHERLRADARVVDLEGVDIRDRAVVSAAIADNSLSFCSVDVSFISLTQIWDSLLPLLHDGARVACLIKPQFEAGRAALSKRGVVRDARAHVRVLDGLLAFWQQRGVGIQALTFSPVRGGEGNIEYLALLTPFSAGKTFSTQDIVRRAMTALSGSTQEGSSK